jgi:hypothetical protein
MGIRPSTSALLLLASGLSGCLTVSGAFYPIRGPLAAQSPLPVYPAKFTGAFSGTISVTLGANEVCSGSWSVHSGEAAAKSGTQPLSDMAADWDAVYGSGYYNAQVLGAQLYSQSELACNAGGSIKVEFANPNNTPHNTVGVGMDSHGNLFKITVFN